jgi:hypothetical protein
MFFVAGAILRLFDCLLVQCADARCENGQSFAIHKNAPLAR